MPKLNVEIGQMDVKEAVAEAKKYILDLFKPDGVQDVHLEEVEFDDRSGVWAVTVSFSRAWEQEGFIVRAGLGIARTYKIVRIGQDGKVNSVKDRPRVAA